jgi:hypothetical protein
LIASDYLTYEQGTAEFKAAFESAVNDVLAKVPPPPGLDQMAALKYRIAISNRVAQIRKRALEELISDYVGTLLFGPSALLASYEIFSLQDLDAAPSAGDLYPPSRYRLRFVYATLCEENFVGALGELSSKGREDQREAFAATVKLLQRIAALTSADDDLKALDVDLVIARTYAWVKESLDQAKKYAKEKLPADMVYSSNAFLTELPELIARLDLNVPPSELGTFPDIKLPSWQSALMSGWIMRIMGKRLGADSADFTLSDFDALHKLVLRAIENIGLHREYLRHMQA